MKRPRPQANASENAHNQPKKQASKQASRPTACQHGTTFADNTTRTKLNTQTYNHANTRSKGLSQKKNSCKPNQIVQGQRFSSAARGSIGYGFSYGRRSAGRAMCSEASHSPSSRRLFQHWVGLQLDNNAGSPGFRQTFRVLQLDHAAGQDIRQASEGGRPQA